MAARFNHITSVVIIIGALVCTMLSSTSLQLHAQTPAPTPDPEIVSLRATVQAQQGRIDLLQGDVTLARGEAKNEAAAVANEVGRTNNAVESRLTPITILGIIATVLGIGSVIGAVTGYLGLRQRVLVYAEQAIKKKFDDELNERFARINPGNVPMRGPRYGFDEAWASLQRLGFQNVQPYDQLDASCLSGCVLVPFTKDPTKDPGEADAFRRFLDANIAKLDKTAVGYVIYTPYRVPEDIIARFPIITYANSIVTLGTNALTIARSVIR